MKFNELYEARLAGSGMIGVLTDGTTEGDSAWGSYGVKLQSGQSLEHQVANWLIKDFYGGIEDFEDELAEELRDDKNYDTFPNSIWIVSEDLYNLVHGASQQSDPGGDAGWDAQHQLMKTIYRNAATDTLKLDWKKFKKSFKK